MEAYEMADMIICGLSMEMELARELNRIGDCRMCLYCEWIQSTGKVRCSKKGIVKQRTNCKDWVVDHR